MEFCCGGQAKPFTVTAEDWLIGQSQEEEKAIVLVKAGNNLLWCMFTAYP